MSPLEIVLPIRIQRIEKSTAPVRGQEDAHGQGFSAGYEEGRLRAEWEGERQRQQEKERVQGVMRKLENLHHEFEGLLAEHLPDLIQGALNRVFRAHPFTIAQISAEVSNLLRDLEQAGRISLECSPTDAEELRLNLEQGGAIPDDSKWLMQANPALSAGEFLLKSDLGDVDGRYSSRVRQIHSALETKL